MAAISGKKMIVKKVLTNGGSKVTARADSTGLENDQNQIVKHHHSVKKMQTPSVRNTFDPSPSSKQNKTKQKHLRPHIVAGGATQCAGKESGERGE